MEKVMFGAGCFWGVEDAFRQIDGVIDAPVGYAGGHKDSPTYQEVCQGGTGHAEVCQVHYDPDKVSFSDLLNIFWKIHDPTQVDRQGVDVGSQYRSAIYFYTPEQEKTAKEAITNLEQSKQFSGPIATEIKPAGTFWRAEEYHQQYNQKNGRSCHSIF